MTWIAWRLQRTESVVLVALAVAAAVFLVAIGLHAEHVFALRRSGCPSGPARCLSLDGEQNSVRVLAQFVHPALYAVPFLIGALLGSPVIAGESAQHTTRLAWTQSTRRSAWLGARLLVASICCLATAALLAPITQWWTGAAEVGWRILPAVYDTTGVVTVAYALFAFALASAAGSVIRRPGWAFAVAAVLFAAVRALVDFVVRAGLVPVHSLASAGGPQLRGAWKVIGGFVPTGRLTPAPGQSWNFGVDAIGRCLSTHGPSTLALVARCNAPWHWVDQYHPASQYWPLQFSESAIFVAAAMALLGGLYVAVRRGWVPA